MNEFNGSSIHGDRAVMFVAAAVVFISFFSLWHVIFVHWLLAGGLAAAGGVGGYVRHAKDHNVSPTDSETMKQFADVTQKRAKDMKKSANKFYKKGNAIANTLGATNQIMTNQLSNNNSPKGAQ